MSPSVPPALRPTCQGTLQRDIKLLISRPPLAKPHVCFHPRVDKESEKNEAYGRKALLPVKMEK